MKNRREAYDKAVDFLYNYLVEEGAWRICENTCFYIDPLTSARYPGDVAFLVQLGRDQTERLNYAAPPPEITNIVAEDRFD